MMSIKRLEAIGIEAPTLLLDEGIEAILTKQPIQTLVEWMPRASGQIAGRDPQTTLPTLALTHCLSPGTRIFPCSRTGGNHFHHGLLGDADIKIDGRRYARFGAGPIAAVEVTEKGSKAIRLGVIEWLGETEESSWHYSIVWVDIQGRITGENFSFAERSSPLYRAMLAQFVSPYALGFKSQALKYVANPLLPDYLSLGHYRRWPNTLGRLFRTAARAETRYLKAVAAENLE